MKNSNIYALIQARCSSSRLPGKVLRSLAGEKILLRCIERAEFISEKVKVAVITGTIYENDPIREFCSSIGYPCFSGSEDDVLDRYCQAAVHFGTETVIRLTADNPIFDYENIRKLLIQHLEAGADYSSSKREFGSLLPLGIGAEIFQTSTLKKLNSMDLSRSDREHVNDYILDHPNDFKCSGLKEKIDYSNYNFSVDTLDDFTRIETWINKFNTNESHKSDFWKFIINKTNEVKK